ncbi:GNAT family N-acetyltransferase [Paenibacillus hodogayensis]|uniref:GNAT family N-acetyltransferase n=1 Tax=Paenibacillus hodogayensis TaxID=279208 RepID=A0ABV5W7V2_9BACL
MFKLVAYQDSMQEEWDRFAQATGTVFHTTAFRRMLLDSFGYTCLYHAVLDSDGALCAILPMVGGRNLGLKRVAVSLPFVNYTDICAVNEEAFRFAIDSVEALRNDRGLAYVELRCKERSLEGRPGWSRNVHNHTFVLPLEGGEEQVLALSSGSNRNHVRKAYKNDWFDVSFDTGHLEAFYEVYVGRMKQLGSPAPHIRYFRSFFDQLPGNAHLLTVLDKQTGVVVGGMVLVTSPGNSTVYYPYGSNRVEYNSKYVNNFMYWEAAKFGMRGGFANLDLGRSQTGSGTYKYKQQWGAVPRQLEYAVYAGGGSAGGPPDKESLSMFVGMWKAAPRFVTDPAGRMLIKYIFP